MQIPLDTAWIDIDYMNNVSLLILYIENTHFITDNWYSIRTSLWVV